MNFNSKLIPLTEDFVKLTEENGFTNSFDYICAGILTWKL